MAKKITPATSISRDAKMSMKPITDEEFLYGEVWKLHQEVPDIQVLASAKLPATVGVRFDDADEKNLDKSFSDSDFDAFQCAALCLA